MGNKIVTRNGVSIDLAIPAQITSFETDSETSSHVTRGKLKVFYVGKTGDIREFTKDFAEDLVKSLPGTPVVAFWDEESEDFIGHNDEQYVYGYVPEDAIPEFVEEDGKTWSVVDVNLFTERQDQIGEIANKIIGKSQSLELNPDTVDWELVYVNNELKKIVFKKGSFYGLSVLGDKQKPAFTGSSFFTEEALAELRSFQERYKNDGGNHRMNKTEFLSLGMYDKMRKLEDLIRQKKCFDEFWVKDFDEEQVIVCVWDRVSQKCSDFAASFKWSGEDKYEIGDFYPVMLSYVKKTDDSSEPSGFAKKDDEILEQVGPKDPEPQAASAESSEAVDNALTNGNSAPVNVAGEGEQGGSADADAVEGGENVADNGADVEGADVIGEASVQEGLSTESGFNEEGTQNETEGQEAQEVQGQENPANASALSSEERDELDTLRKEKKMSIIEQYKEFLTEDDVKDFIAKIDTLTFETLENELKIKSFEANKERLQKKGDSNHSIILPNVENTYGSSLERSIAENLKR